jgi:polyhydroxyalkanoate synthesis regulator phasin
MAQNDLINRSLEAGRDASQKTQDRLEALVRDLTKAADDQRAQAQQLVQDLIDRSRRNSEQLFESLDARMQSQLAGLGLATKADIERLERKIEALGGKAPATKAAAKASAAKAAPKVSARTSPAKKAATKKTAAKKAPARKPAAKKAAANKAASS